MVSTWSVDYASINTANKSKVPNPVGYDSHAFHNAKLGLKGGKNLNAQDDHDDVPIKVKRAWDVAMSPAKNIPMNAIMIYMSGNGVQIFSVMITFMLFFQPAKAIMTLNQTFERFESKGAAAKRPEADLLLPKLTYIGLQLVIILLGVYKINNMGLLPTTTSDWLAFLPHKEVLEYASI
ncbi:hypothetical protein J3Q64DRAFT_1726504 [Phycomyces blakesleeanus]|uniref:ER membrane protein complex subunit 4 n=2 Tax=Phycomyces blakesleeanus TaxID=4837 RepID=A0ABR3B7Q9_PHYBL